MSGKADTSADSMPFSRPYAADDISYEGTHERLLADSGERAAIARTLGLPDVKSLRMDFRLHRSGRRRFKLKGHLFAEVTQTCVVSLDPVEAAVEDRVDVEFWPPEDVARLEAGSGKEGAIVPLEGPEPIIEGIIDVGHLAYEHLAAALDPYPRKAGAAFEWQDPSAGESGETSDKPFAELARLKPPKDANLE